MDGPTPMLECGLLYSQEIPMAIKILANFKTFLCYRIRKEHLCDMNSFSFELESEATERKKRSVLTGWSFRQHCNSINARHIRLVIHPYIYLSVHISVHQSIHTSIHTSIHSLSIHMQGSTD